MFVAVLSRVVTSMVHLYNTVPLWLWIVVIFSSNNVGILLWYCRQFVDLINEMNRRRRKPHKHSVQDSTVLVRQPVRRTVRFGTQARMVR